MTLSPDLKRELQQESLQKLPLTLAIISLNEEALIEQCIRSVPFASEVIVVDSGSSDSTCSKALALGAKVIHQPWLGFGLQKNKAVDLASYDWILSLDADECLSSELQSEILKEFEKLNPEIVYEFPRTTKYLGKWIRHGGWYPDSQRRLFNKQYSRWDDAKIHERVISKMNSKASFAPGKTVRFRSSLLHFAFPTVVEHVATNNRYSSLLALKDYEAGKRFSYGKLVFKPFIKFIETYFLKRGFLDGYPGFVISMGASYSIFLRIVKLKEYSEQMKINN